ncbi:MAG: hypothetical protein LBI69_03805 [Puniceicoccales bacterium]|jgi:hypothetical protein|nr:hypothetical protein [Puniceicoccales bacterium]
MNINSKTNYTFSDDRRMVPVGGPAAGQGQDFSAGAGRSSVCPDWATPDWEKRYDRGPLYRLEVADRMLAVLTVLYRERYEEIRYLVYALCASGYDHSHVERILRNKYEELKEQILAERDKRQQRIQEGDGTVVPQTDFEIQLMQEVRKTKLQREQKATEAKKAEEDLAAAIAKTVEMQRQLYELKQNSDNQIRERIAELEREGNEKTRNAELKKIDSELNVQSHEGSLILSEIQVSGKKKISLAPGSYPESEITRQWNCNVTTTLQDWRSAFPPSEAFLRGEESRKQRVEDRKVLFQKKHEEEMEKQRDIKEKREDGLAKIDTKMQVDSAQAQIKLQKNLQQIEGKKQEQLEVIEGKKQEEVAKIRAEVLESKAANAQELDDLEANFRAEMAAIEANEQAEKEKVRQRAAAEQLQKEQAQEANMEVAAQPHSKEGQTGVFGRFKKSFFK